MLAGGVLVFLLMIAYLIFALTLADLMQLDLVPPDKAVTTTSAM
ncbi:MAG TPA: hypothetical protein VGQ79_01245 [Nitrospiraceae bacterium]|nr:hypothetical protein [Nitrospiraceae bacterium]